MANKNPKPMTFGRVMLASALGVLIVSVVGCIVMFLCTVVLMAALSNLSKSDTASVRSDTFLTLDMNRPIYERAPGPLQNFLGQEQSLGLADVIAALKSAADDDRVRGLYIKAGMGSGLSWGSAEELRRAVASFAEKKCVLTYGESFTQQVYYIATAGDRVCMHPSGMLDFRGLGGEVMFYKDLLDKLDVDMQLIRPKSCSYKSAGEVYTMNHMSDANRQQIRTYIHSIWNYVADQMATSRGLTTQELNRVADNLEGCLANDALQAGLVDTLCFRADMRGLIKDEYDGDNLLSIGKYASYIKSQRGSTAGKDRIAVIYAQGDVVDGTSSGLQTAVYGNDIVKALADAASDKKVKAIVLRVNSPGGVVTASEAMTHAVEQARKEKPVVVSMSDVAASAGYEMSCKANVIVAQPTTITGSIGVFATLPNVGRMLKNKVGITTDTVMTNRNATGLSLMRPLSPTAMAMMERNVEEFYLTFVDRVATGRNLRNSYVDSIARGRVWTGLDALRLGLVDTLGGLQTAIEIAASLGETDNYITVDFPKEKDAFTQLIALTGETDEDENTLSLLQKARLAWVARGLKGSVPFVSRMEQQLRSIQSMQGLQVRMPFILIDE